MTSIVLHPKAKLIAIFGVVLLSKGEAGDCIFNPETFAIICRPFVISIKLRNKKMTHYDFGKYICGEEKIEEVRVGEDETFINSEGTFVLYPTKRITKDRFKRKELNGLYTFVSVPKELGYVVKHCTSIKGKNATEAIKTFYNIKAIIDDMGKETSTMKRLNETEDNLNNEEK